MSVTTSQLPAAETRAGVFNYLAAHVESSLYRNGKVLTRRDPDGSDGEMLGVDLEATELQVVDARPLAGGDARTLEHHGFELLHAPPANRTLDFFDHQQVVGPYYAECAALVAAHTGARVYAFDHNIRSASGKKQKTRISGGQQVQGPAHVVHGDYTLTSAPQRIRDLSRPPGVNDTLRSVLGANESLISPAVAERAAAESGRFAIINVWRSIVEDPVVMHPMALCDGRTVDPDDLVVFEIHYADRIGENYFAKHATRHGWYFYPEMTRDEALLIKQWDSAGTLARSGGRSADGSAGDAPCTFSFHSAFADPTVPPDAPDRWSCEVRCLVVYD